MSLLVYLDIAIDNEKIGRIVCELFKDKATKAADNFYHLCKGDKDIVIDGKKETLTYKNNYFHRVVKTFVVQAGDIMFGSGEFAKSENIGRGGCSVYATQEEFDERKELPCYGMFEDENLGEFTEPMVLAMANTGNPNTNSSQFFIVTSPSPHLNGKHTIFGKVLQGKSVVRTIESMSVDSDGFPENCIKIEDCGEWDSSMEVPLYNACNYTIGNDIYEEYPSDDTHFDSEDFTKAFEAANIIKESGSLLYKKKDFQNAFFKYKKSLNYVNEYFPDPDTDKENFLKFNTLKMKIYLNLCLVLLVQKKYDEAMKYATYLLEMSDVPPIDQAKAYYRRGNCYFNKKRYDDALKDYNLCREKNPNDKVIVQKIEQVEKILEEKKEKVKKNIAKFFE